MYTIDTQLRNAETFCFLVAVDGEQLRAVKEGLDFLATTLGQLRGHDAPIAPTVLVGPHHPSKHFLIGHVLYGAGSRALGSLGQPGLWVTTQPLLRSDQTTLLIFHLDLAPGSPPPSAATPTAPGPLSLPATKLLGLACLLARTLLLALPRPLTDPASLLHLDALVHAACAIYSDSHRPLPTHAATGQASPTPAPSPQSLEPATCFSPAAQGGLLARWPGAGGPSPSPRLVVLLLDAALPLHQGSLLQPDETYRSLLDLQLRSVLAVSQPAEPGPAQAPLPPTPAASSGKPSGQLGAMGPGMVEEQGAAAAGSSSRLHYSLPQLSHTLQRLFPDREALPVPPALALAALPLQPPRPGLVLPAAPRGSGRAPALQRASGQKLVVGGGLSQGFMEALQSGLAQAQAQVGSEEMMASSMQAMHASCKRMRGRVLTAGLAASVVRAYVELCNEGVAAQPPAPSPSFSHSQAGEVKELGRGWGGKGHGGAVEGGGHSLLPSLAAVMLVVVDGECMHAMEQGFQGYVASMRTAEVASGQPQTVLLVHAAALIAAKKAYLRRTSHLCDEAVAVQCLRQLVTRCEAHCQQLVDQALQPPACPAAPTLCSPSQPNGPSPGPNGHRPNRFNTFPSGPLPSVAHSSTMGSSVAGCVGREGVPSTEQNSLTRSATGMGSGTYPEALLSVEDTDQQPDLYPSPNPSARQLVFHGSCDRGGDWAESGLALGQGGGREGGWGGHAGGGEREGGGLEETVGSRQLTTSFARRGGQGLAKGLRRESSGVASRVLSGVVTARSWARTRRAQASHDMHACNLLNMNSSQADASLAYARLSFAFMPRAPTPEGLMRSWRGPAPFTPATPASPQPPPNTLTPLLFQTLTPHIAYDPLPHLTSPEACVRTQPCNMGSPLGLAASTAAGVGGPGEAADPGSARSTHSRLSPLHGSAVSAQWSVPGPFTASWPTPGAAPLWPLTPVAERLAVLRQGMSGAGAGVRAGAAGGARGGQLLATRRAGEGDSQPRDKEGAADEAPGGEAGARGGSRLWSRPAKDTKDVGWGTERLASILSRWDRDLVHRVAGKRR
ncbi:hypothetical protein QJQ45_023667 [Haematococcus lacustris]|nr:hypothetical protein QJQ45_023667 [Haematococcus lacustris]